MSRIVIGIHGLGNKPPAALLEDWWYKALREGLYRIGHPGIHFRFEMVYWADILHDLPLNPSAVDKEDALYLADPYIPSATTLKSNPTKFRRMLLDFLE